MDITLSEAFTFFLSAQQRNFYARIISSLIRAEAPGLGTIAVGISKDGRFVFYYDPEFVNTLPLPKFLLILAHEVYHLILGHIPRFLDLMSAIQNKEEQRQFSAVANYAWDLACNELMRTEPNFDAAHGRWFYESEENPQGFLIPETFQLERNQAFEVYQFTLLSRLKKAVQELEDGGEVTTYYLKLDGQGKQGGQEAGEETSDDAEDGEGQTTGEGDGGGQEPQEGQGQGEGSEDDKSPVAILERHFDNQTGGAHRFWEQHLQDKTPEEQQGIAERLRHEAKSLIRKAAHEHKKSRGTFPAGMKELLDQFLATPTIPWPQLLRSMCMRTRQTKLSRGMSRPSRRMHGIHGVLPFPGRARDNRFTIWYALDTSGSMSKDDLAMGLLEILNIVSTEPEVTISVMYCDAALHVTYDVETIDDVDFNVVGRGGTDFNPPFEKLREMMHTDKAPDVLIYATDGYAPAPRPENRVPIPVIWLLTPGGVEPSPDYGVHIRMEPF